MRMPSKRLLQPFLDFELRGSLLTCRQHIGMVVVDVVIALTALSGPFWRKKNMRSTASRRAVDSG